MKSTVCLICSFATGLVAGSAWGFWWGVLAALTWPCWWGWWLFLYAAPLLRAHGIVS